MSATNVEQMIREWDLAHNGIAPEDSTLAARLEILTYRALAEGATVTAERLATLAQVPVELAEAVFARGRALGGEWDTQGRLVGNVLTLNPTPHRFRVNGRDLYTWCSLDAMHLPGLLGQTAEVESVDPLSGETIRLTVPPVGNPTYRPAETVLTIVLSGGDRSGPQSPLCRQMHFFAARENAEAWLKTNPGATIMTVEEVTALVRRHIHDPLAGALEALS